ncbi:MAG: ABC transporter permease [Halobaculum sp.]
MTRISGRYLAKRLVASYLTLLAIMSLMFVLLRSMPGSFVTSLISSGMTQEQVEAIRATWGLNEPLWKQYVQFMINYQTGEFGRSPTMNTEVWDLVVRRFPRTAILFGATFLMGFVVGPLVGSYLGWFRGSSTDKGVWSSSMFLYSMPAFWISWLFIWLLNYELGWLPSAYMFTQFPTFDWTAFTVMRDVLYHILLPLASLSFIGWVGAMLIMRTQMVNVTDTGYVHLAKAKGLSDRTVMIKHAARNALIPVATSAILSLALLLDGAVIVESVFSWPGMGSLIVTAVLNRDFPVAQAAFFMLAVLIVAARLVTDIAYTYLDPRIKFGEQN